MPVALAYSTPPTASGEFALEFAPHSVTLRYPLLPKWVRFGSVLFNFAVALFQTLAFTWIAWRFIRLYRSPVPVPWTTPIVVTLGCGIILWWLLTAFSWLDFRRWRGWSRSLYADPVQIVLSTRGIWRVRQRTWPSSSVTDIACEPLRSMPGTWPAARITIRFRDGRPLRLRITSRDRELPTRFVRALSEVLGLARDAAHESVD